MLGELQHTFCRYSCSFMFVAVVVVVVVVVGVDGASGFQRCWSV